jgi:phosphatidylinositol 4-kinase
MWFLESYLNDMQQNMNIQTEGFLLVKRLYHRCQTLIFSETNQDDELKRFDCDGFDIPKSAHVGPVLIGMGLLLAAIGAPMAFSSSQDMVKIQSRQPRFYDPFEEEDSDGSEEDQDTDSVDSSERNRRIERWKRNSLMTRVAARIPTSSPSLEELSRGSAFTFQHYLKKTSVHGSVRILEAQPSSASALADHPTVDLADRAARSLDLNSRRSSVVSVIEDVRLANSHYFHAEIQFLMTLIDISERLVSFPKHTRQSSLIAELTLLNHNLPAKVCIPFWCPCTSSNPHHHQIVRIALSDCVVLNSAERVPFLICVEVIDNGAENVRRVSIGARSPSMTTPTPSLMLKEQSTHDVEYHQAVLSRRESAIKNHQLHLDSAGSLEDCPGDEFSEKMRTAAVMLAQLYQQQQKEMVQFDQKKKPSRFRSSTASSYQFPKPSVEIQPTSFSSPTTPATEKPPSKLRTDFELIRKRVLEEMAASEAARLAAIASHEKPINEAVDELLSEVDAQELLRDDEDPSASVFREPWDQKKKRIRDASPYGSHPNWQLYSVIVKSGADLRQEQLALQLICEISRIWDYFSIPIWVFNFRILITSDQSGLIETIPDSMSIHSIKKQGYQRRLNQPGIMYTLYDHFISVR